MKIGSILLTFGLLVIPVIRAGEMPATAKESLIAAKELTSQQDAMAIIRKQLALALSTNKEQASLTDALAACRRLAAPSFIIDLLSDPSYGWKRMAPSTLCHNDGFYTRLLSPNG